MNDRLQFCLVFRRCKWSNMKIRWYVKIFLKKKDSKMAWLWWWHCMKKKKNFKENISRFLAISTKAMNDRLQTHLLFNKAQDWITFYQPPQSKISIIFEFRFELKPSVSVLPINLWKNLCISCKCKWSDIKIRWFMKKFLKKKCVKLTCEVRKKNVEKKCFFFDVFFFLDVCPEHAGCAIWKKRLKK